MKRVPPAVLNRIVAAADARLDELEEALIEVLSPVLDRAADEAARGFEQRAVDFLRASAFREAALTAAAPAPASTMIAVYPRVEEAEALALEGEDAEPPGILHVTLAYLGETDEGAADLALEVVRAVAGSHAPLVGVVGGVGSFGGETHADGTFRGPSILLPDVPGLAELRVAVTQALVREGIDYSRDHGFQPHITLAYSEDAQPPPADRIGLPLHFDELVVARGDVPIGAPLVGFSPLTADASWSAPVANEILDIERLIRELRARIDPVRLAAIAAVMTPMLEEAGLSFDVTNPLAGRVLAQAGSQVTEIAETTQLNVMRAIKAAYEEGLSIPNTAKAIRAGMKEATPARARLIARTELAGAVHGGSLAAVRIVSQATTVPYYKRWRVGWGAQHPRHELVSGLNGQTVPLDGLFDVRGSRLDHPGDPTGPAREICACRCTMQFTDRRPASLGL